METISVSNKKSEAIKRVWKSRILVPSLLVICCLYCLFSYQTKSQHTSKPNLRQFERFGKEKVLSKLCYKNLTTNEARFLKAPFGNKLKFLNDILYGMPMPSLGRSIFFIETSCGQLSPSSVSNRKFVRLNVVNLTIRAACAIESAALHNPNSTVFVLFASPAYWNEDTTNPIKDVIRSYSNVQLRNVNMWNFVAKTPIEQWFSTDKLFGSSRAHGLWVQIRWTLVNNSLASEMSDNNLVGVQYEYLNILTTFLIPHMSDLLRYLTLWHFGGTYLDTDVIVLRTLEHIPSNYAGAESVERVNGAILNFGYDSIGREVANDCLHDLKQNFDGKVWAQQGPLLLTRVLKRICNATKVVNMFDKKRCKQFQVFDWTAFYAVDYEKWFKFFNPKYTESTLKLLKESFVAHTWNFMSKKLKFHISAPSAFGKLAAKHCPKVFSSMKEK